MLTPVPPEAADQKTSFLALVNSGALNVNLAEVDDEWFIISLAWLNRWREYVDIDDTGRKGGSPPGPIDNSDIVVSEGSQRLRNSGGLGSEFEVVDKQLWEQLLCWYALAPGSPVLMRKIVQDGGSNLVEISSPVFELWEMNASTGVTGRACDGLQIVGSRKLHVTFLILEALKVYADSKGNSEPDDDWVENMTRCWYSLDDFDENAALSDADAAKQWQYLDYKQNLNLRVMDLQVGDHNVAVVRMPRILIETRTSADASWVLPAPTGSTMDADGSTADADNEAARKKAEAEAKAAAAAEARNIARQKSLELPDKEWRQKLSVGDELDCFDGKTWQESLLVGTHTNQALQLSEGQILVRFRRNGPLHTFLTTREAGAALGEDAKPESGAIAKPYTHVSDWRTQLRQDMKIEVMVSSQHAYRCEEAGTTLHFVGSHTHYDEWWISDHVGYTNHSRRGYANVEFSGKRPPTTEEKPWDIWVNIGNKVFETSVHLKVSLEGKKGEEDIRVVADKAVLEEKHPGFAGNPAKLTGLYKRQGNVSWDKRKVVRVDYKKRQVTISKIYGGYNSYMYAYKPQHVIISLDSDEIRELSFSAGSEQGVTADADDVRENILRGTAGLRNLGNTCFMNSVLQSIFAVSPFAAFFADTANVEATINTKNFLGTGGKLARAFTALVHKVALSTGGIVSRDGPLGAFKATLGQFAPTFAGFQQQDAMEFFNQFTSLIHEDLNRVKKKPYVEDLDDDGAMTDAYMADESWRRYRQRNDSIVVDLFQGQFRSHLTCPDESCAYESRRFDPFSAIACPLPKAPKKKQSKTVRLVTMAALDPSAPRCKKCSGEHPMPLSMQVKLRCAFKGSAVAEALSEMSGIPVERLIVMESYSGKFFRMIFHAASRTDTVFAIRDHIIAFEVPEDLDLEKQILVELRVMDDAYETPLLLPIERSQATSRHDICVAINEFLKRRLITSKQQLQGDRKMPGFKRGDEVMWDDRGQAKHGQITSVRKNYTTNSFVLRIQVSDASEDFIEKLPENVSHCKDFRAAASAYLDSGKTDVQLYSLQYCEAETYMYHKSPASSPWKKPKTTAYDLMTLSDDDKKCPDIACIKVNWNRDLFLLVDQDLNEQLISPPEWTDKVDSDADANKKVEPEVLSLHNSLRAHNRREQLGANDEWYCRGCKKHVQAFKKMDIWRLPPLLVFHLKRFTYEVGQWATHREKLDSYVDFPFEIDMSHYMFDTGANGALNNSKTATGGASTTEPTNGGNSGGGKDEPDAEARPSMHYELVAISNHMGGLGGGHYTAYVKRGQNWYDCNDSSVRQVDASTVRTAMAYVLFYRRMDAGASDIAGGQENLGTNAESSDVTANSEVESKSSM